MKFTYRGISFMVERDEDGPWWYATRSPRDDEPAFLIQEPTEFEAIKTAQAAIDFYLDGTEQ